MYNSQSPIGATAQLDGMQQYGDNPRTPTTPTIEQLLRAGEASRWSPNTSPTFGKDHDPEEDHAHHHKKSVLAKVKEKAKKWRQTLSKKKHNEDDNTTPSWGVTLEEDEDEDEEPEYFGAPMYESELAPEDYKETARQHPRAVPVIPDEHVLASNVKLGMEEEKEKPTSPNKTLTETVTEKLAPAYATVSDATHAIVAKIQGLTVSSPVAPKTQEYSSLQTDKHATLGTNKHTTLETNKHATLEPNKNATLDTHKHETLGTKNHATLDADKHATLGPNMHTTLDANKYATLADKHATLGPNYMHATLDADKHAILADKAATLGPNMHTLDADKHATLGTNRLATLETDRHASPSEQVWDKGVSVKEYLMHKLEPGEDERALSQVIVEAMSPRRSPGDVGVVEKVKEAVTSLLWSEEPSQSMVAHSATNSSSHIPISTNAHEVVEEENHGRILQAN